ncbi:hypothetical protein F3Y22_tig00110377pilonHSYRG00170 [Hibiscus syriacus]|uniref:Integrase catalytic domain-containing protein n=1 Tax=Hibiscus syriacus TaxID=106335 RepID=A0A6A3AWA9_HIBSY|nr:hypothetical protein F3Y22_tig00110377pilonHSYRG00170 [Hibiscus syriacus]
MTSKIWSKATQLFANKSTSIIINLHYKFKLIRKGDLSMRAYIAQVKEACDALAAYGAPVFDYKQIITISNGLHLNIVHFLLWLQLAENLFPWKTKLESMIQKKMPRNKANLVRRSVKLEYKDGQSMIEHLNNFKGLINQLKKTEMKIDDELQALILLSSLPESWDTLVVTLSNSALERKLTMDTVSDSLLGDEARRMERGRSKSRLKITCYYYGRMGHKKMECRSFKRDQKAGNILNISYDDSYWIVDSGAFFHVTPHGSFFSSYQSGDFGTVQMGNQDMSKIIGIEDIILNTSTGCKLILKDERHVLAMRLNLISVGKLDDAGLINYFAYCKKYDIRLERTPPKTPQLNGLAKIMNRTIEERVRCVLSHDKLPKSFWGEAIMAVVDIVNLTPSVPLNGGIPKEVWMGKRASYNHLKVFGCRAFVHIPKYEIAKLDAKMKECIYLCSPKDEFGYRLWDPVNKKVVHIRDIVFFEDQTIEDIKNSEKPRLRSGKNIELTPETHDEPAQEEPQSSSPTAPEPRRSSRYIRPSTWYNADEYVMLTDEGEPQSYKETTSDTHKEEWRRAMQEEIQSLHENHIYELVELPKGIRALKTKWMYWIKTEDSISNP